MLRDKFHTYIIQTVVTLSAAARRLDVNCGFKRNGPVQKI